MRIYLALLLSTIIVLGALWAFSPLLFFLCAMVFLGASRTYPRRGYRVHTYGVGGWLI